MNSPSNLPSSHSVWALFWILFEIGVLIGFILLGIAIFKRTPDQMYYEACTLRNPILSRYERWLISSPYSPLLAHMTATLTHSFCDTIDINATPHAVYYPVVSVFYK